MIYDIIYIQFLFILLFFLYLVPGVLVGPGVALGSAQTSGLGFGKWGVVGFWATGLLTLILLILKK